MAFEQRDNSGALFSNLKRGGNEKAPHYTGDAMIDGREYRMSAWVKQGKKGKFMSLAFSPKEEGRTVPSNQPKPRRDLEEVPF